MEIIKSIIKIPIILEEILRELKHHNDSFDEYKRKLNQI